MNKERGLKRAMLVRVVMILTILYAGYDIFTLLKVKIDRFMENYAINETLLNNI